MCGVCGAVTIGSEDLQTVVEAQLSLLEHRGPDAKGHFGDSHAVIGQNRLAIIDLARGDPPITNERQSVAAVLNGEIYNFRELRRDLSSQGHQFASDGDTEVIAHLAEELAPVPLAQRLDGMFAFAVWDQHRKRLILGRDRVGKKPLFYWSSGGRLVFGSEVKVLFAHPSVPRVLDPEAIPAYLTFGYVPTPRTFFAGVRSLPPGHVLTFEPGGEPLIERYWEPPIAGLNGAAHLEIPLKDAAAELRSRLEAAVARRLVSDVPLGAFLSGGIDSGTIVGIMASQMSRPVETFTIGFEDKDGFDERPQARQVAARHGTHHHEFVVQPNAVELIERLVWYHDQPFGDSSAVPTFLLSEMTKRHVTVALSGDGGDELFAGYERFIGGLAVHGYKKVPSAARRAIRLWVGLLPQQAAGGRVRRYQRFVETADRGLPDAYRSWISFIQDDQRDYMLGEPAGGWALDDYRTTWTATEGARPLDRLLDLNMRTYLLDDLLVKVDRMSMAHGLEVRSPFLDPDLISFAARLPPQLKAKGLRLKRVLKAAALDLLPQEIVERPKKGFGVPLDRWFREDLCNYVASTLAAADARVKQHLAPLAIDQLIEDHDLRRRNHGHALWTLLTLEIFLRREGW